MEMTMKYFVSYIVFAACLAPVIALAETTLDVTANVDVTPLLDATFQTAATVLLAIAPIVVGWLAIKTNKLLGLNIDEKQRAVAEHAFGMAIQYGLAEAKARLPGRTEVEIRNEAVALAVRYAIDRYPDTLNHFGFTDESIADAITARLGTSSRRTRTAKTDAA
jgi:hypothetical protein